MAGYRWTSKREEAALLVAQDELSNEEIARRMGISRQGLDKWKRQPEFQGRVAALDGRPRLFLVRGAVLDKDPALVEAKLPACTEEEIEGYVWDVINGRKRGEEPMKVDDHGMDCVRYVVAHRDVVLGRRARGRKRVERGDAVVVL